MMFGKMVTGLWLVRFSMRPVFNFITRVKGFFARLRLFCAPQQVNKTQKEKQQTPSNSAVQSPEENTDASYDQTSRSPSSNSIGAHRPQPDQTAAHLPDPREAGEVAESNQRSAVTFPPKPKSLYPPSILGLAMVARGEVGYLIASLAQSQGMFSSGSSGDISEIYLVIIWAISICTLVGPICVGTLVKRVKKLQETRGNSGPDPLGVWGI